MAIYRIAGPYQIATEIVSLDGRERRPANGSIWLPNGDEIAMPDCWADGTLFSDYDLNHNLVRLSPQGEVVWQVVRDENGRFKVTWEELLAEMAQEKYPHHLPFMQMCLADPHKRDEHGYAQCLRDETNERGYAIALADKPLVWRPGCMLLAKCIDDLHYDVDIETGIAKNITPPGHRPW